MSHRNVEQLLGRLVTDEAFRDRFAADPVALLQEMTMSGYELNWCELRALAALDLGALERFVAGVDPRLQKSDLHGGRQ